MLDHLSNDAPPGTPAGTPDTSPAPHEQADIHSLMDSALQLSHAMQSRLLNPDGTMKKDVPVREGKEAVASISTLLGMILRNKTSLEDQKQQQQFDAAVLEVLEEMDLELRTTFLDRLQVKINKLKEAA